MRLISEFWRLFWGRFVPGFLIGVVVFAAARAAFGQTPCAARAEVVVRLSERWDEAQVATGMMANGASVELWASEAGSWTMIAVSPAGRACLVASGEAWSGLAGMTDPTPSGEVH